ncbi:alanine racemase [Pilimelia columellifera]|uniref:Alanine racemase n=1 Tax=Pilimelia columellifera subsp. columellifera TaxID=706583 RepID=A0ABN3NEN8_9ACTN
MWQAETRIDLNAVRGNVARMRATTTAEIMAVVKGDGYGHGATRSALAALAGGATWLGVCSIDEALALRADGITAPVLAWLLTPGADFDAAVANDIDVSVSDVGLLAEARDAARRAGRPVRAHLKVDTGLARGGATAAQWPQLVEAAAKAQADESVEVVGCWSHFVHADSPRHRTTDDQIDAFSAALTVAERGGVRPRYRHLANSAATLTRPDTHFDLVRPGLACYGLSPIAGETFGLTPAMTARARVALVKRVPAGQGVSYAHTYHATRETTLALVPIGYADGVPRAASNVGPVQLGGVRRRISGRVCMDQFIIDCGDDPVAAGDVVTLFGSGADGAPTADDWAAAIDTINYEIVTRFGSLRAPLVFDELLP